DRACRGESPVHCRLVAREIRVGAECAHLKLRTAIIEYVEQRAFACEDNVRRVARAVRQLGESHEIPLNRGEGPEGRAQSGARGYVPGGAGQLTPLEALVGGALHERQRIAKDAGKEDPRIQPDVPRGLKRGPARLEDAPITQPPSRTRAVSQILVSLQGRG